MVSKPTNALKCMKMYDKHSITSDMFRPLTWPSSGKCVTDDGYIENVQKFVNQSTDVKYRALKIYSLNYILKFKIQIKKLINSSV